MNAFSKHYIILLALFKQTEGVYLSIVTIMDKSIACRDKPSSRQECIITLACVGRGYSTYSAFTLATSELCQTSLVSFSKADISVEQLILGKYQLFY